MATIITQPASLSLSANLGRFEIAASSEVSFKLSQGGSTIIDESFTPNAAGRVIIDIKDVVRNNLALDLPTTDIFQQTSIAKIFTAEIDELADVVFTVIRGGVENLSETPSNFLLANWLTWQPQTKQVSTNQPEWLTYYAPAAAVVKVKFYLANDATSIITLHSPAAGTCYTYNMQFAYIMTLQAGNKYGYYDVWVENESQQRVSYIQRYIYRALESIDEHFVFENSLGGLDTAVMTGESTFAPDIQHNEGVYDEVSSQLDSIVSRLYTKNTGWKPKPEADWLFDFFNSKSKYKVNSGTLRKIVIVESPVDDTSSEDLKSFEFKYKYSTDLGLLNLSRSMDVPAANLEITTPEGLFF